MTIPNPVVLPLELRGEIYELNKELFDYYNVTGYWVFASNWQEYYPHMPYCDLEGANLGAADLVFANLTGADFTLSDCWVAFFVEADLEGTNFGGANLSYAYFDETGNCTLGPFCDGYDDVSYDAGAESGDLNLDGVDNVLDVVILVNNILNP